MATEIVEARVLPTGYLSLSVRVTDLAHGTFDGFEVTASDGVTSFNEVVELVADAGYDVMAGIYFLPRVFRLVNNNDNYSVQVQPTLAGVLQGTVSAALLVWPGPFAAPEIVIRQLIADKLNDSPIPLVYDADVPVWVKQSRFGKPETIKGLSGKPGAEVEVGVPYMAGEDPFANSTDIDTQIMVPMRVAVKGDDPDRGEDAVNAAYLVRGVLRTGLDLGGFGITKWTWSGGAPEMANKIVVVSMTMSLTRVSEEFCPTPVLDGNIDEVPDFVMDGGEV